MGIELFWSQENVRHAALVHRCNAWTAVPSHLQIKPTQPASATESCSPWRSRGQQHVLPLHACHTPCPAPCVPAATACAISQQSHKTYRLERCPRAPLLPPLEALAFVNVYDCARAERVGIMLYRTWLYVLYRRS